MHSRILITILLLVYGLPGQAQYSTSAKMLMQRLESQDKVALQKQMLPAELDKRFSIVRQVEGTYVLGTLDVSPDFNASTIEELGIKVYSRVSQFINVAIPLEALRPLGNVKGIRYIQISVPAKPRLDAARFDTWVDEVHQGAEPLESSYTGAGVVVGIIDGGFDLTHPTFYDSSGNIYRIQKVWDTAYSGGNPPTSFDYGTEFTGATEIQARQSTSSPGSHGSHVASTAGGSGRGSDNRYVGVAPGVEYVLVDGLDALPNSINYIFDYANSVNKAAVINMSLGSHIGPHDGTSMDDQQFDLLVGPGKILVGAAGNEGDIKLHLSHNFTGPGDTVSTVMLFEDGPGGQGAVDMWGSSNSGFSVQVALYDADLASIVEVSGFKSSADNDISEGSLGTDPNTADYQFAAQAENPYNNSPNIQVYVVNNTSYHILLSFTSSNGEVHAWNHAQGNGAPLSSLEITGLSDGDSTYTVGEGGGTAKSIISVGAYNTKSKIQNVLGDSVDTNYPEALGAITSFSSIGPTVDGRIKPDITAPGNAIVAAYNSFAGEDSTHMALIVYDNWSYGSEEGTSMASPFTAGVIALMLEANRNLTPDDVKGIFDTTATRDDETGEIAVGSSTNTWGRGKIYALGAVDLAAQRPLAIDRLAGPIPSAMMLHANYPNPFNPSTILRYDLPVAGDVALAIYDVKGREVNRLVNTLQQPGSYRVTWNGRGKSGTPMASGIYFARITGPDYRHSIKMVLLK